MAARDAARRAELFPKWRAGERPLPPPLQDQQRRRRQEQQPEQQQQQQQRGQQQQAASLVQPQTSVSIIVPALNEEAGLEGLLRYLQGSLQPAEIIVVDGGSTDGTVAVARRCGVRVVAVGRGRARQMNAGAAVATGGAGRDAWAGYVKQRDATAAAGPSVHRCGLPETSTRHLPARPSSLACPQASCWCLPTPTRGRPGSWWRWRAPRWRAPRWCWEGSAPSSVRAPVGGRLLAAQAAGDACRVPRQARQRLAAPPAASLHVRECLHALHPAEYGGRPLRFFSANNTLKSYYLPALLRPLSFARCAVEPRHLARPPARLQPLSSRLSAAIDGLACPPALRPTLQRPAHPVWRPDALLPRRRLQARASPDPALGMAWLGCVWAPQPAVRW